MAQRGFQWVKTPSGTIGRTIAKATAQMEPALGALAANTGSRGETQMRSNAPWQDRTGFARASLYGRAEGTDVVLGTSNAEYGVYLELGTSRMAPREIIGPTLDELAPQHFEDAAELVMRLLNGGGR